MKLIAFDLDGTALNSNKELTPHTERVLRSMGSKGVILVPATGRIKGFIPKEILKIPDVRYLLTSNGASVYDLEAEKIIYQNGIPLPAVKQALDFLLPQDIYLEVYADGIAWNMIGDKEAIMKRYQIPEASSFFLNKTLEITDDLYQIISKCGMVEKINLPYLLPEKRSWIWERLDAMNIFHLTSSVVHNVEVNHRTTNKGRALKALTEYLNLNREDVMAIGDNGNDLEMLRYAGISVAMGNATREAIQAAKAQTASCDEDGFAKAVELYFNHSFIAG